MLFPPDSRQLFYLTPHSENIKTFIPYLLDCSLLQMLLHCLLDKKLLPVELHVWVFFPDEFHDGLIRNPGLVVTRLKRKESRSRVTAFTMKSETTDRYYAYCVKILERLARGR